MDKPYIVVILVLYLFLSSFACAKTFDTAAWNPGLDYDIQTHDVDFSSDTNLSEMSIEVIEGEWRVESGNLTSLTPVSWFVLTDEIEISKGYPITKEYTVYGMNDLTRFTVFYGDRLTLLFFFGGFQHSYWEFDIENNVLSCVTERTVAFGNVEKTVHYNAVHDLSGSDVVVKSYIDKPWGLAKTDVLSEIYVGGVKIASAEWEEWMASEIMSATGGIYTEVVGLKVHSVVGMKKVDQDDSGALGSLGLVMKLMLFKPPAYEDKTPIMPLWLNLVFFKVPLFMLGFVILLIIRGTE